MPNPANDELAKQPVEPVDSHVTSRFRAYMEESPDPLVAAVLTMTEAIVQADENREAKRHLSAAMDMIKALGGQR